MWFLHVLMAVLSIVFFGLQSYTALATDNIQPKTRTMIAHTMYLIIIITGLLLLRTMMVVEEVLSQWVVAKGVLLLTVMSSSVKAFRPTATQEQRKMGIFIAAIGLIGIVTLALVQPQNLF